ncbi:MAG: ABC transporter substrate-binding protein [Desulfobacterales bacterium]|nr:MAG: ABC transporter substrate-binding protein [Desulfobacterales bacterium]
MMKRSFIIVLALATALCLAAVSSPTKVAAASEVVKIGYNAPLSGPAAAWGLPGLEGVGIWLEEVNGAGGIKAGDKSYKVEVVEFDNEGDAGKALLGARKLILEDKVAAMLMLGGAESAVVQPFVTKNKIITFVLIASDIAKDRPYLMDVTDNFPVYHLLHIEYIGEAYPKAKRAAILSQDDEIGLAAIAWSEAGFDAAGIEVTYSKPFGLDTTDFAPIVTAALATKPDILSMGASYPEFQALILEQAYTQGWKGIITSACWDFKAITAKVPVEWMEGAVSGFPDFDDPKLSKRQNEFYAKWQAKYPDHGFSEIVWEYMGGLDVWKYGVEKAGSVDSEAVYQALKSSSSVPHAFGPGVWWGTDVFGLDNLLVPNWPITEIRSGKPAIVAYKGLNEWLARGSNKDTLFKYLKKWNMMK